MPIDTLGQDTQDEDKRTKTAKILGRDLSNPADAAIVDKAIAEIEAEDRQARNAAIRQAVKGLSAVSSPIPGVPLTAAPAVLAGALEAIPFVPVAAGLEKFGGKTGADIAATMRALRAEEPVATGAGMIGGTLALPGSGLGTAAKSIVARLPAMAASQAIKAAAEAPEGSKLGAAGAAAGISSGLDLALSALGATPGLVRAAAGGGRDVGRIAGPIVSAAEKLGTAVREPLAAGAEKIGMTGLAEMISPTQAVRRIGGELAEPTGSSIAGLEERAKQFGQEAEAISGPVATAAAKARGVAEADALTQSAQRKAEDIGRQIGRPADDVSVQQRALEAVRRDRAQQTYGMAKTLGQAPDVFRVNPRLYEGLSNDAQVLSSINDAAQILERSGQAVQRVRVTNRAGDVVDVPVLDLEGYDLARRMIRERAAGLAESASPIGRTEGRSLLKAVDGLEKQYLDQFSGEAADALRNARSQYAHDSRVLEALADGRNLGKFTLTPKQRPTGAAANDLAELERDVQKVYTSPAQQEAFTQGARENFARRYQQDPNAGGDFTEWLASQAAKKGEEFRRVQLAFGESTAQELATVGRQLKKAAATAKTLPETLAQEAKLQGLPLKERQATATRLAGTASEVIGSIGQPATVRRAVNTSVAGLSAPERNIVRSATVNSIADALEGKSRAEALDYLDRAIQPGPVSDLVGPSLVNARTALAQTGVPLSRGSVTAILNNLLGTALRPTP
jgi:hypothetical protein